MCGERKERFGWLRVLLWLCMKIWVEEGVEKDLDSGREMAGPSVVLAEDKTKLLLGSDDILFMQIGRAHV